MFLAFGIHHAMRMGRVFYGLPGCTISFNIISQTATASVV
jgi:hypothetical protein